MNIFSLFSNAMRVTGKIESAACGAKPTETDALINELCDARRAQPNKSEASASDVTFKVPLPYPS